MQPHGTDHKAKHWEGPRQPRAIYDDQATHEERQRCLAIIQDARHLRSLTNRRLLVKLYRQVWGGRTIKAWIRELEDPETHPERLRCMAVIQEFGERVENGELDHLSRLDLLAAVSERVRAG
ncbi:MAG: hypothetical protein AAGC72_16855 [Planctomycetota bacterium]